MKFVIAKGRRYSRDYLDVRFVHSAEDIKGPTVQVGTPNSLLFHSLEYDVERGVRPELRRAFAQAFEEGAVWARQQIVRICRGCGDRFFPDLDEGQCQKPRCLWVASVQGPWQ